MSVPLAEILRPKKLSDFVGQKHLVGKGKPLSKLLEKGKIPSLILWGPPGSGKTTLARLIASYLDVNFVQLSAVTSGVADVKAVIKDAKEDKGFFQKPTLLFIDEIHRFNKAQQDAFLPHVEDGTIILIGATTENPGFNVIAPLLSRAQVLVLHQLSTSDLAQIIKRAVQIFPNHSWDQEALDFIAENVNGDARALINAIELAANLGEKVTLKLAREALQKKHYYDKAGDSHYDTISAFIKSMRGGDANATLHYLARMLKAGEDPMFIARRMVIFAAEDIGNARPNALVLASSCMQAVHMIGMPEAKLILAQTATYLATAPKSIASTIGIMKAEFDAENMTFTPIPLHLRNAVNKVVKQLGYGKGHVRYPWLEYQKSGKAVKQQYLPDNIKDKKYYEPDWE